MRKLLAKGKCYGPTDRPMDRPTDGPTDTVTYRVACTRLKILSRHCAIAEDVTVLPGCKRNVERKFWDDDLSGLKAESIDAYDLWNLSGRPNHGAIYELKKSAHYYY